MLIILAHTPPHEGRVRYVELPSACLIPEVGLELGIVVVHLEFFAGSN